MNLSTLLPIEGRARQQFDKIVPSLPREPSPCEQDRLRALTLAKLTGLPVETTQQLTPDDASDMIVKHRIATMRDEPEYRRALQLADTTRHAQERGRRLRAMTRRHAN